MRDYPDVNNASLDILNTALDMAFGHMSPQKTGTLVLNRKYVTSATVFAITNGQLGKSTQPSTSLFCFFH